MEHRTENVEPPEQFAGVIVASARGTVTRPGPDERERTEQAEDGHGG